MVWRIFDEVEILDYADHRHRLAIGPIRESVKVRPIRSSGPKRRAAVSLSRTPCRQIGIEALPREDLDTHDAQKIWTHVEGLGVELVLIRTWIGMGDPSRQSRVLARHR